MYGHIALRKQYLFNGIHGRQSVFFCDANVYNG